MAATGPTLAMAALPRFNSALLAQAEVDGLGGSRLAASANGEEPWEVVFRHMQDGLAEYERRRGLPAVKVPAVQAAEAPATSRKRQAAYGTRPPRARHVHSSLTPIPEQFFQRLYL